MKPFKLLYILSTFMWGMFSVMLIGFTLGHITFNRLVAFSFFFIAILIEEQYYLIKEKIIDVRKV